MTVTRREAMEKARHFLHGGAVMVPVSVLQLVTDALRCAEQELDAREADLREVVEALDSALSHDPERALAAAHVNYAYREWRVTEGVEDDC